MPVDGRLPAVEETLTIDTAASSQQRQRRTDRADVAHDVELPVGVPLLVGDVLEPRLPRDADVVHEHVEPAERSRRVAHGSLGLARASQVGHDVRGLADAGRVPSSAGDGKGALADELAHHLEPDPSGRAGDEAPLAAESEIHEPG